MGSRRQTYPGLKGEAARRAMESERAADDAFDRREEARLKSDLDIAAKRHAERAEQRRVKHLIERDRADRVREEMREAAEMEIREGVMVNLTDTVVEPTPEWISKGDIETYLPSHDESRTVRTVATVRRIRTPLVARMQRRAQISRDAAKACMHYSDVYERAGLVGHIPSTDISREVFSAPHSRAMFTASQLEAQSELDSMRTAIPKKRWRFFEAVVVLDIPLYRSARYAQMRRSKAEALFVNLAEGLADFLSNSKRLA